MRRRRRCCAFQPCTVYGNGPAAPDADGRQAGSSGPPYGLLQGALTSLPSAPPLEGAAKVTCAALLQDVPACACCDATPCYWQATGSDMRRRGSVCMIAPGKDFFIAATDHPEWDGSFTVWGRVRHPVPVMPVARHTRHITGLLFMCSGLGQAAHTAAVQL